MRQGQFLVPGVAKFNAVENAKAQTKRRLKCDDDGERCPHIAVWAHKKEMGPGFLLRYLASKNAGLPAGLHW